MSLGGFTPNRGWGIILKKLTLCALLLVGTLMPGVASQAQQPQSCIDNTDVELCKVDNNLAVFSGGYSVEVPPMESTNELRVEAVDGSSLEISVESDKDGNVFTTVEQSPPLFATAVSISPLSTTAIGNTNCGAATDYELYGKRPADQPFAWWYNPAGQPATNSIYRIGEAFQTWIAGKNRCNTTVIPNSYVSTYMGSTTKQAAVKYSPAYNGAKFGTYHCGSPDPKYKNVIGWLLISELHLGVTCTEYSNQGIWESSVVFNTFEYWYTTFDPSMCSGQKDLKATATHEIGHTLGLDEFDYASQSMYLYGPDCFMNGRGLGYGDVHGIEAIYP
jgi:hypothetical protein